MALQSLQPNLFTHIDLCRKNIFGSLADVR